MNRVVIKSLNLPARILHAYKANQASVWVLIVRLDHSGEELTVSQADVTFG